MHLKPAARPLVDFIVSDDGSGAKIVRWDTAVLGPRPTPAQITAARAAAQAARDAEETAEAAREAQLAALRAKPRATWTAADRASAVEALFDRAAQHDQRDARRAAQPLDTSKTK
ncbi:MAG: hypothetical protein H0W76_01450 [Pyrinomonadaceae bacterium]|nr:hypothetical protein [Pyrinomonadaceae bacterium]